MANPGWGRQWYECGDGRVLTSSGGAEVLVDEAAEAIMSLHSADRNTRLVGRWPWEALVDALVGRARL